MQEAQSLATSKQSSYNSFPLSRNGVNGNSNHSDFEASKHASINSSTSLDSTTPTGDLSENSSTSTSTTTAVEGSKQWLTECRRAFRTRDVERSRQLHTIARHAAHSHHHSHLHAHTRPRAHSSPDDTDSTAKLLPSTSPSSSDSSSDGSSREIDLEDDSVVAAEEKHGGGGKIAARLKCMVYGGIDGILTTFATVASVAGGGLSASIVLIIGMSHIIADGISMGTGDAMSSQAEIDYNNSERDRELWEMENNLPGEIEEMIDLYVAKGVSRDDARSIMSTVAKYKTVFLDLMMMEELKIMPSHEGDDDEDSPIMSGMITMLAFIVFGSIPMLPYLLVSLFPSLFSMMLGYAATSTSMAFIELCTSLAFTLITLFVLGAIKGAMVDSSSMSEWNENSEGGWWKSGMIMTLNGTVTAVISYSISYVMTAFLNPSEASLAATAG